MGSPARSGEAKLKVRIKKMREGAQVPAYQTAGAAAVDLHACIDKPLVLQPLDRETVPTGIALELPAGYEAQVRARSSLPIKFGVGVANGIGTVDSDYRGEIFVPLINWGKEPFTVEPGMRIAQLVIAKYEVADWQVAAELEDTERGSGAFGSTGYHGSRK